MRTRPSAHELFVDEETVPLRLPVDEDPGLWVGVEVSDHCHINGHVNAHGEVEFDLSGADSGASIRFKPRALQRFVALANHLTERPRRTDTQRNG